MKDVFHWYDTGEIMVDLSCFLGRWSTQCVKTRERGVLHAYFDYPLAHFPPQEKKKVKVFLSFSSYSRSLYGDTSEDCFFIIIIGLYYFSKTITCQ